MTEPTDIQIRPLDELDIDGVITIDEKVGGKYRPDYWERRIAYTLRRDPESAMAAMADGSLVGFMLGQVRSGEFGLDEPTGWIEVMGVDPDFRGRGIGRALAGAVLDHFRQAGAKSVHTLVDEGRSELSGFFTSLGFAPSSMRPFVKELPDEPTGSAPRGDVR